MQHWPHLLQRKPLFLDVHPLFTPAADWSIIIIPILPTRKPTLHCQGEPIISCPGSSCGALFSVTMPQERQFSLIKSNRYVLSPSHMHSCALRPHQETQPLVWGAYSLAGGKADSRKCLAVCMWTLSTQGIRRILMIFEIPSDNLEQGLSRRRGQFEQKPTSWKAQGAFSTQPEAEFDWSDVRWEAAGTEADL